MNKQKDLFLQKSKSWDMHSKRVKNAKSIASLIVEKIALDKQMTLMDFGAGTGLLSFFISQKVGKIVAVDNSPSMLAMLKTKTNEFASEVEIIEKDLSITSIPRTFDGIISSMTIHHLDDTLALFKKLYDMLEEGGFIAIADLDSEDGTFHSDNTGVFHHGFDRDLLQDMATQVGFKHIHFETASIIKKPHQSFTVFLMTAYR